MRLGRLRQHNGMKRRLLNLLTALSLLLCVAVALLWVRGHWVADCVRYTRLTAPAPAVGGRLDEWNVLSGKGVVALVRESRRWSPRPPTAKQIKPPEAGLTRFTISPAAFDVARDGVWQRIGFNYYDSSSPSRTVRGVRVPHWLLAALTAAAPALWAVRRRRRREGPARSGVCPRCGYDLRATPGRCPECGTMPPAAPVP
jgi:hypothetical protein